MLQINSIIDFSSAIETTDQNFINSMPIQHYYINDLKGNEVKITKREAQALQLLAQGKTFAEAAYLLRISPRTFEKYVENLKDKFNLHCRSRLIDVYFQTNLKGMIIDNSSR